MDVCMPNLYLLFHLGMKNLFRVASFLFWFETTKNQVIVVLGNFFFRVTASKLLASWATCGSCYMLDITVLVQLVEMLLIASACSYSYAVACQAHAGCHACSRRLVLACRA